MQTSKIYHISEGRKFPLISRESGPFRMEVVEAHLNDLSGIHPARSSNFHIFLIQSERGQVETMLEALRAARHLDDFPKVIILPEEEYARFGKEAGLIPRALVLDDDLRPLHLKLFLELSLQLEYYRNVVYRLSHDSRERGGVFESLLELARGELRTQKEETGAYSSLLEYEQSLRDFDKSIQGAMEQAMNLKDQEILDMKSQLEARERLSDYRDFELKRAKDQIDATEIALDMSTRENLERDKIISALDSLRIFTDKELMDLFHENQELRKKLGMPPRDT